jgi:hypothetical protein
MSINRLYDTWFTRISQLRIKERRTRARNMAWLIIGILLSGSVHLTKVAGKIPFGVKLLWRTAVRTVLGQFRHPGPRVV